MRSEKAIEAVAAQLHGGLIVPGDPGYDESREIFNAMYDRRPAVIARCASTQDVAAAVDFARDAGLELAVRCGGHSVAGLSTCDGGMMIHLGGLNGIHVDPGARIARASGGVLTGDADASRVATGALAPTCESSRVPTGLFGAKQDGLAHGGGDMSIFDAVHTALAR